MADYIQPPIGIGPSPPSINGRPANPGGNPPPSLWIPPTNNPNTPTPNNPPPNRRFNRDIPGLRDTDVDIPGVPDIERNQPYQTGQRLPLQPFQPNWQVGHPLPWNNYSQTIETLETQHPDSQALETIETNYPPLILGINKQG